MLSLEVCSVVFVAKSQDRQKAGTRGIAKPVAKCQPELTKRLMLLGFTEKFVWIRGHWYRDLLVMDTEARFKGVF